MKTDLRNFKQKYRVTKGEEWKDSGDEEDRKWLSVIQSRKPHGGHIYTYSETHLGYMSKMDLGLSRLKPQLLKIDGVELSQQGDTEFAVIFPVELLDTVAAIVNSKTRMDSSQSDRLKEYWAKKRCPEETTGAQESISSAGG